MLGLDFGPKAKILGLGLEAHSLGFGLDFELETQALLQDIWFSSTVVCKFSAEDNNQLYNGSYV